MADVGNQDVQSQLDDLRAVVAATKADVSGLQEGARRAERRADASDGRATATVSASTPSRTGPRRIER